MTEHGYTFDYSKTMMMKLFLSSPNVREGGSCVNCTFEKAMEVVKLTDALTLGVPKIIYLVGWQYDGHDDKYPAFFEVNPALARDCDETPLDSLLWLIEEAKKYHTTVSLHINFSDIYDDSPLWEDYVAAGAVIRDKEGKPDPIEQYNGKPCYKVSFKEEWESGLFLSRWNRLCEMIPLRKIGTVHVDNFLCCYNNCPEVDIAEMQDYRDIILDHLRSEGVDVTSEFTYREGPAGRDTYSHFCMGTTMYPIRCLGRIGALWWFDNLKDEEYLAYHPSYFGGGLPHDAAFADVFYGNIHGEELWLGEKLTSGAWVSDYLRQFCMIQLPYFWLVGHKRLSVVNHADRTKTVYCADGVVCRGADKSIAQNGITYKNDRFVSLSVPWMEDAYIVYADDAGERVLNLPDTLHGANGVYRMLRITAEGLCDAGTVTAADGQVTVSFVGGDAYLLRR